MIFQVTVCALKYRKIAWLTLRQMQLFTKAWQKGDWTEVSLSFSPTHSLTRAWFISTIPKNLKVIFVIHLQAGFAHCFAHPHSCKQWRFPTCKQTQNLIYLGFYVGHLSFWRPSESVHSLLNVRLSESRYFFGPALTLCWAKNKVHRVHTHIAFTVLIPRQRYFVPIPKQTRQCISLHYLNVNRQERRLNRAFFHSGYQKWPSQTFKTHSNEIIQKINKKLHLFSFLNSPPPLLSFPFFVIGLYFFESRPAPWEHGTTVERFLILTSSDMIIIQLRTKIMRVNTGLTLKLRVLTQLCNVIFMSSEILSFY